MAKIHTLKALETPDPIIFESDYLDLSESDGLFVLTKVNETLP